MTRISIDDYFMAIALSASLRATCPIRQVGTVVVDQHDQVLSTGYNGVPRGHPHCSDSFCGDNPCMAIHSEANALLQCPDIRAIQKIYCTLAPCLECAKLIANTSVKQVFYLEAKKPDGIDLLESLGITTVWLGEQNVRT
jgi:dCMP deaminase